MAALYSTDEMMGVIQSLAWSSDQAGFANDPQQDKPLLFRAHNQLESHAIRREYGGAHIIHATPCLNVACHILRAGMHKHYENMPPKYGLLSVYEATRDQRFYPDEHLESVAEGRLEDKGVALYEIDAFNDKDHHETALTERNTPVGLYMWRIKGFAGLEFAPVPDDHPVLDVLKANQKVIAPQPTGKPAHMVRLTP
jgi:hypothetical protein